MEPDLNSVLRAPEAIELASAWVQHLAETRGIRAMILKGPAVARQDLLPPHLSADVDVLIEPNRFDEFVLAAEGHGWRQFPDSFGSARFTLHSRTLWHPSWPISLDAHAYWPGFLRPADEAFDVLWSHRVFMEFGHRLCTVPDRPAHIAIVALHSLRSSAREPRHEAALATLARLELSHDERSALSDVVLRTGSAAPLHDLLTALSLTVPTDPADLASPAWHEWRRKVAERHGPPAMWWQGFLRAAPRERPMVLRHALWPTRKDLLVEHPGLPDSHGSIQRARLARLDRGMRQTAHLIATLARRRWIG